MDEQAAERLEGIGSRDHSVTAEYRIFGPPGTGKTTSLTRQIQRAVDRFGDSVLVTSFSRAAAAELAGREIPLHSDHIGTLHGHCFRALGNPAIAEVHVKEWNRENPRLPITPVSKQVRLDGEDCAEDGEVHQKDGDRLLQQLNCCRGMMLEPGRWPAVVREFASKWDRYKRANRLLDFCDLIELSLRDVRVAPGNPAVIMADEAQDLNKMQLTLIRMWAEHASYLALAGDDDQTIYAWTGASPEAILNPEIPEDHKVFLKQSQRVPRAVHAVADRLIRQVTRRPEKTYLPRPEDGAVHRLSQAGYHSPEYWILKTVERHLKKGKSIMFLASCSYMLRPIVAVLRKNAIPFYNPYRKSNGFWNPLRIGSRHSAARRILALLDAHLGISGDHRNWTCGALALWMEWLRGDGVVKAGAGERVSISPATREVDVEALRNTFEPAALETLLTSLKDHPRVLLDWWQARLSVEFRKRVQFPANIARLRGPQALRNAPQIVVGTIHSVKGGQADV
ncbi:MAG: UvrD-helicase domain-containing protein, partial [Gammaproteobacteria bacterium]